MKTIKHEKEGKSETDEKQKQMTKRCAMSNPQGALWLPSVPCEVYACTFTGRLQASSIPAYRGALFV